MNSVYGSLALTSIILFASAVLFYMQRNTKKIHIVSQAELHHRFYDKKRQKRIIKTQSQNHFKETNINVIIVDNEAFWIKNNIFYKAQMSEEGVDKSTTQEVDTIAMDKVQLDKMLFIMDKLREGIDDDSRSSRDE
jgi:Flp pilus assembly protein TadB